MLLKAFLKEVKSRSFTLESELKSDLRAGGDAIYS